MLTKNPHIEGERAVWKETFNLDNVHVSGRMNEGGKEMVTKSFNEIEGDKLERIFELQRDLNDRIVKERDIDLSYDEWIRQWCLAIFSETNEILDEINWKHWKNYRHIDNEAVKEEIADVLHFVVSLALTCGMTADDLFERYTSKNGENHERQDGTVEGREDYKAN